MCGVRGPRAWPCAWSLRLAVLLAQDLSLADAADELSVSQHTVRTHVKRIFSKTTTERQSGLIRLLVSGPGQVRKD